jgi:hypothetical protein
MVAFIKSATTNIYYARQERYVKMKYINDEKDPSLLGTDASVEEIVDVQKMIDNLVRDSCYEDAFIIIQSGNKVYVKQKGSS